MLEYRHSLGVIMGVFDRIFSKKQDNTSSNTLTNRTVDQNNVIQPRTLVTTPIKQDPKLEKKLQKINLKLIQTTKRQREEMLTHHNHEEQKLAKELEKIEREIAILEGRELPPIEKKTNTKIIAQESFDIEKFIETPHAHAKINKTLLKQQILRMQPPKTTKNIPPEETTNTKKQNATPTNVPPKIIPSPINFIQKNSIPQKNQLAPKNNIPFTKPNETNEKQTIQNQSSKTLHPFKEKINKIKASLQTKNTSKQTHSLPPHKRPLDEHHAPLHAQPSISPHHIPPHKKYTQETSQTPVNGQQTSTHKINTESTNNQLELAILELQAKWQLAKNKSITTQTQSNRQKKTSKINTTPISKKSKVSQTKVTTKSQKLSNQKSKTKLKLKSNKK